MNRRRLAALVVAAIAGGLGPTHVASAGPLEDSVDLRTTRERYWACVAVDTVELGTCVRNPLPNPGDWGEPPI